MSDIWQAAAVVFIGLLAAAHVLWRARARWQALRRPRSGAGASACPSARSGSACGGCSRGCDG